MSSRPADALPTYLEQVALVADVDTMEDDPRGRVTLITLHSAKGLEFPVVFIVRRRGRAAPDQPRRRGRIHRSDADGGGAPPVLRRHYPGDGTALHHLRRPRG